MVDPGADRPCRPRRRQSPRRAWLTVPSGTSRSPLPRTNRCVERSGLGGVSKRSRKDRFKPLRGAVAKRQPRKKASHRRQNRRRPIAHHVFEKHLPRFTRNLPQLLVVRAVIAEKEERVNRFSPNGVDRERVRIPLTAIDSFRCGIRVLEQALDDGQRHTAAFGI